MQVPFYDFQNLHHSEFRDEIKKRLGQIIDEGSFIEGPSNAKFETQFAALQKSARCLLVANGTDALEIALKVLGVKAGDKVGVPGITFYATAEAVLNIGATPVWIDVELDTALLCMESLKRVHQKHHLKAVMPVHIYGLPVDMKNLLAFCEKEKIEVVEDAAQAQGAFYAEGGPVGSLDTLCTFSFYPTKNLSAFGDAGAILTQSEVLANKIIVERNHGRGNESKMGRNSRCDHMQAAVLEYKLEDIEKLNNQRKEVASWYHQGLKNSEVHIVDDKYLCLSSWHLYPVRLKSQTLRLELMNHLKEMNIGCTPFYERSLSQEPSLLHFEGEDQNAKELAGKMLCLPMNPFLSKEQVQHVCKTINQFLDK